MLKRKVISQLENWYNNTRNKALLLKGTRQVGKTTAVRMFAATHYKHFVEINFVKHPAARQAFDGDLTTHDIVLNLSSMGFGPFVKNKTLVFLDEIQECPNARTAIKFLVEEGEYDYIESGSLLGINYKPVPSYPVGSETELTVYPLDFEEFLWAKNINSDIIDVLRNCYRNCQPVPAIIHNQMCKYYREYLIVGGMPEVVYKYINESDFSHTIMTQRSIMLTYRDDISHYAGKQAPLVKRIFDAVPAELGKQDKRFILSHLEKNASLRKYEDPTQWLADAGVVHYSFNTTAFELPFEATENRKLFKLYMADTGLLSSQLLNNMQYKVLAGEIEINEGALTENFVAQALRTQDISLHYYDKKSKLELDFVIPEGDGITIIEVKSGNDYKKHASLNNAIRNNSHRLNRAIVLSQNNIEIAGDILYLPLYMAMFMGEVY